MPVKIDTVIKMMNQYFNESTAESWDNTGLVCGDINAEVTNVITCVDITKDVLTTAQTQGANLIIAHHPLAMKPFLPITPYTAKGSLIWQAVKHDIALYCAHTNVDIAEKGLCYQGARKLGLTNIVSYGTDRTYKKLILTYPGTLEEEVHDLLEEFGALSPVTVAYGDKNRTEATIAEERCNNLANRLHRLAVDINIYTLDNARSDLFSFALGDITPSDAETFVERVKDIFDLKTVHIGGNLNKQIRKVAFCSGAGKSFLPQVIRSGADAYVTGDIGHHDFQTAYEAGILLVDATHYGTEKPFSTMIKQLLIDEIPELNERVFSLCQNDYFSTYK
jgi:dinuclear metal center YbgI/SA1388 family protein